MELKEAVKRRAFYLIAIMLSFSTLGSNTVITYYKTFGQTFIKDDHFFAITGSIGGVFNSFGRLFWGYMIDRYSFKVCHFVRPIYSINV
jgi:MFS family permease